MFRTAIAALIAFGIALAAPPARADLLLSTSRSGITFGGELGFGTVACDETNDGGCESFNSAPGLDVHLGGMLSPRLALVGDVWGMRHAEDHSTFSQAIATAGLRVWLLRSIWLAGGIGAARVSWTYDSGPLSLMDQTDTVPAVMGAIGWELISTPKLAVEVSLRAGAGFYGDSEDKTELRNVQLGIGLSFF
jgi:hypothetical protein